MGAAIIASEGQENKEEKPFFPKMLFQISKMKFIPKMQLCFKIPRV